MYIRHTFQYQDENPSSPLFDTQPCARNRILVVVAFFDLRTISFLGQFCKRAKILENCENCETEIWHGCLFLHLLRSNLLYRYYTKLLEIYYTNTTTIQSCQAVLAPSSPPLTHSCTHAQGHMQSPHSPLNPACNLGGSRRTS